MFGILSILSQLEEKLHFYCFLISPLSLSFFCFLPFHSISLPGMREKDSEITRVAELGELRESRAERGSPGGEGSAGHKGGHREKVEQQGGKTGMCRDSAVRG